MTEVTDSLTLVTDDLAWAIGSASPTELPGFLDWCDHSHWFEQWLQNATDTQQRLLLQRTGRLGKYFEALWLAYWDAHPDWNIRLSHYPVYENGRTIGELDVVLEQQSQQRLLHIELAVKFFLLIPGGQREQRYHWVGPGLQDSLGRKYQHMMHHQLPLGRHSQVTSALGRPVDRSEGLLKGRFFQPYSEALPTRAPQWLSIAEARKEGTNVQVQPLARQEWLAGVSNRPWWPLQPWLDVIGNDFRPHQVWWQTHPDHPPAWRFVVPDQWPEQAVQMVHSASEDASE